ncbi:MAG: helix-turn-helix transcriptional regulator [Gemmatimonadetes bacterium]|nr:helix-turn-helix transcriptional regulator [Gemmatimonadota bacterium]
MTRNALGEFEHLILLGVLRLGDQAYGVSIIDELEGRTGREVSQAATYIGLKRLRDKGLLASRLADPSPERGERARRYFTVTDSGIERLRESAAALFSMWEGLDPKLKERIG